MSQAAFNPIVGMPGIYSQASAVYRKVMASDVGLACLPGGRQINGTKSRDPLNTDDTSVLRAGLLMGKITATGLYASSVLGVLTTGVGGAQTTAYVSSATAVEMVRRIGSSGSFTLTGPVAGVSAKNAVEAIPIVTSTGSAMTFTLTIEGATTGAITFNATPATMVTNINNALNAKFGSGAIVASGASLAAIILTFTTGGFGGRPLVGHATSTITQGTGAQTVNGSTTAGTSTTSVTGVVAVAAGSIKSEVVAYSAVNTTSGAITITAIADTAVSAVNAIQTLAIVDNTGSGTFTLTIEGITTAAITYNATYGTLVTAINSALDAAFGTSAIVASAGALSSLILTFSGSGYAARPITGLVTFTSIDATGFSVSGTTITAGIVATSALSVAGVSYAGVNAGDYGVGSFIGDTDGSESPVTFIGDGYGIKVTDGAGTSKNVHFAANGALSFPVAGIVNPTYDAHSGIINYPADTTFAKWLRLKMNDAGCRFIMTDAF